MRAIPDPDGRANHWLVFPDKVGKSTLVAGARGESEAIRIFTESKEDYDPEPTGADIRQEAQKRLELLVIPYQQGERETWATQVEEARALKANVNAPAPFLRARAASRNIAVDKLADVVLSKSDALSLATAIILGSMDKLLEMDPIPSDYATNDRYWS